MSIESAIVPVAGLGTRLLPVSLANPKELLPLGRKPVLQWIVEELAASGIRRIILVTSPEKPPMDRMFRRHQTLEDRLGAKGDDDSLNTLWSRSPWNDIHIETVIQPEPRGLGDAVLCARQALASDEPFVVALGDCLVQSLAGDLALPGMIREFEQRHASMVVAFEQVPRTAVSRYGIASPRDDGRVFELEDLVEKPAIDQAPSQLAIAARYVFHPALWDCLAETETGQGGEIQLTDAMRNLIASEGRAYGVRLQDGLRRFDIGNWPSYASAFIEFATADPTLRPVVRSAIQELDHE